jgi:hypothetical protein
VQWLVITRLFSVIIRDNFFQYNNTYGRIVFALEGNSVMPMFNPASGIYNSDDLEFMSKSYDKEILTLVKNRQFYHDTELRKIVFKLYSCGIHNGDYLSALASQLMKHRYLGVHYFHVAPTANSNTKLAGAAKA